MSYEPKFYTNLAPCLYDYLRRANEYAANQFFCVREEIALYRASLEPILAEYSGIITQWNKYGPEINEKLDEFRARTIAGERLTEEENDQMEKFRSLKNFTERELTRVSTALQKKLAILVEMVDRGSQIYERHAQKIDAEHLKAVVADILDGLPEEHSNKVRAKIESIVDISEGSRVARVTPDQLIEQMVGSFPLIPAITEGK